jgi:hypothetical protein
MSLLSRVESAFEAIVEGGFRRLFTPHLQPVEVARALERAMVDHKVVGPASVDVPNQYVASLHPTDFQRLASLQASVEQEIAAHLERRAAEERYRPVGPIQVGLVADPGVRRSFVEAAVAFAEAKPAASPAEIEHTRRLPPISASEPMALLLAGEDGQEMQFDNGTVRIGRGIDNDFIVRDIRVSRHHAAIEREGDGWIVQDLQSTNGTYLAGERVERTRIRSVAELSLGGYRLTIRPAEARRAD